MRITALLVAMLALTPSVQAEPIVSGLPTGQRPGPYSFLVSVGPKRGKSHCFICETADKPGVVIFARTMTDPLAKLVRGIDDLMADPKKSELKAWVTFLQDDQFTFDPLLVTWARKQRIRTVSMGVYEDLVGPPVYRLNKDADVTVMVFVNQKVVHNHAYRAGELNDAAIEAILKEIPGIIPATDPAKKTP